METECYDAYIAIDWGDQKHAIVVQVPGSTKIEHKTLAHTPEAIEEWAYLLRDRFEGKKIAIALEQSRGGLIYALMKYAFFVLYPIHPTTLAKYRQAWHSSGAKDDPTDAELLLDLIERHRDKFTPWKPDTEETRTLQRLVEARNKLVHDRKRLGNRLMSLLKEYYPQVLDLFANVGRTVTTEFILKWPSLSDAQAATDEELCTFFRRSNTGAKERVSQKLAIIRSATPLCTDKAIVLSSIPFAQALARQIVAVIDSINAMDLQIAKLYDAHPDRFIIESLPAIGSVLGPRLIAALGTDRSRFLKAQELLQFSGIAPVTERSGNQSWVHWRYACNKFLRQSFIEWAGLTLKYSFWAKNYYASQRAKGKSHPIAVRALAFKWIRILFRLWRDRIPYSESTYLLALQKAGSPIFRSISLATPLAS